MPWIKIIPEHEAEGELKEVYRKIREQRAGEKINQDRDASPGGPPLSPPMLHSLNPKAMWHTAELMWEIMRGESRPLHGAARDDRHGDIGDAALPLLNSRARRVSASGRRR